MMPLIFDPTNPLSARERFQDIWADEIVYPLWDYAGRDDISPAERLVSTSAALLTTGLNPSLLSATFMTSARGRHLKKWAGHYMSSAADRAYYKHYLKKSIVPLGARVGSRAVPVLGWAMLAHDFYSLATKGKFMGFTIIER